MILTNVPSYSVAAPKGLHSWFLGGSFKIFWFEQVQPKCLAVFGIQRKEPHLFLDEYHTLEARFCRRSQEPTRMFNAASSEMFWGRSFCPGYSSLTLLLSRTRTWTALRIPKWRAVEYWKQASFHDRCNRYCRETLQERWDDAQRHTEHG